MKIPIALLNDLRGGLVAAAVVLPQATALGVTVKDGPQGQTWTRG